MGMNSQQYKLQYITCEVSSCTHLLDQDHVHHQVGPMLIIVDSMSSTVNWAQIKDTLNCHQRKGSVPSLVCYSRLYFRVGDVISLNRMWVVASSYTSFINWPQVIVFH